MKSFNGSKIRLVLLGFAAAIVVGCSYACVWPVPAQFTQSAQAGPPERLTYIDLINRLTDLEQLATLPAPGEKCAQWSSYDRRSKYDEKSGKYIGWSANGDGNGIIRKEDGKLVFAEMQGPGVIWRIWSAMAKEGHVKIYLDYLWENAEAALAYIEAYLDTNNKLYLLDALTILRAIAKHHHGEYGFLTEGVDWNNHVGKQHHFDGAEFGDIKYTEPLLNNLHIVEPTLLITLEVR